MSNEENKDSEDFIKKNITINLESRIGSNVLAHNAWKYYQKNWRAFFGVQIIAFIPSLFWSFWYIGNAFTDSFPDYLDPNVYFYVVKTFSVISWALIGSTYGLSYDILSSGDEFAEFRGFMSYFKEHWWKYILVSLFITFLTPLQNFISEKVWWWTFVNLAHSEIGIFWHQVITNSIVNLFDFIRLVVFFGWLPSITAKGRFFQGLKENFKLLFSRFRNVLSSSIVIFIIFTGSFVLMKSILIYCNLFCDSIYFNANALQHILSLAEEVIFYILCIPITALLRTQIYNSRFPPSEDHYE